MQMKAEDWYQLNAHLRKLKSFPGETQSETDIAGSVPEVRKKNSPGTNINHFPYTFVILELNVTARQNSPRASSEVTASSDMSVITAGHRQNVSTQLGFQVEGWTDFRREHFWFMNINETKCRWRYPVLIVVCFHGSFFHFFHTVNI